MKIKLPTFVLGCISIFSFNSLSAQDYQHLTVGSGYNADIVANGVGLSALSTTFAADNANFAFMSNDFQPTAAAPPAYALPVSGSISSAATAGLSFQMAPFSGNNSLRIPTTGTSGTLNITNGVHATKLYILATSGSGTSTITTVVNFTDDTFQTITGSTVPDWYNSTLLPVAISGFGRVNTTNNVLENPAGNPRLYQLMLEISPANQTKTIESIQFTKTSAAEGVLNVMGITAEILPTCPSPNNLTATSTANSGTVNWVAPVVTPDEGYDYYMSTSSTAPTATTEPTGTTDALTVSFPGLPVGVQHYVWVRSNCGDETGVWKMATFTTGQISATYTTGDIPTLYNTTPTATSPNTCPATLSVAVPAGYQIASTSVSYTMTAIGSAWISEQNTLLTCTTTGIAETALTVGPDIDNAGTQAYTRSGLTIANGATGTVQFELKAWRQWGGSDCNTTYNKVNNNSWTVTVTYQAICVEPAAPLAANQTFCAGAQISDLDVTGEAGATINWYADAVGGEPLEVSAVLETGSYFVSQTIGADCESDRAEIDITITNTPEPIAEEEQILCQGATVADLSAEGEEGAQLYWYEGPDGNDYLGETTELEAGSYFVSQVIEGCESARTEVNVMITVIAEPETNEEQPLCNGATVSDLWAEGVEGSTLNWYETMNAEEDPLSGEAELESGSYFVSQTVDGCESARVEVAVSIGLSPMPATETNNPMCAGSTIEDLFIIAEEGATVNWYDSEDGETPLAPGTELEAGTYYASQTIEGCESPRNDTHVTINPVPASPGGGSDQNFTTGETVASLMIEIMVGAEINWYVMNEEEELVSISSEAELTDGTTYYVTQTTEGCESEPHAITAHEELGLESFATQNLTVHPNPANSIITVSAGEVITDITFFNLLGQKVLQQTSAANAAEINISALPQGNYILQATSESGKVSTAKIIKQ